MNLKAITSPWYIMMIGLPGAGKSTFIKNLEHPSTFRLLSTDNYIERHAKYIGKTYSEVFKDVAKEAQNDFDIEFKYALWERYNIVHDQTNLSTKKRQAILNQVPNHYYKLGVFVECSDVDLWKQRLDNRFGKVIPWSVIEHMQKTFTMPTIEDGFDEVICYDSASGV